MERGDGASFMVAVCAVALTVGLLATAPAHWQWLFDGIAAFAACGLIYAFRAWRRAYGITEE